MHHEIMKNEDYNGRVDVLQTYFLKWKNQFDHLDGVE